MAPKSWPPRRTPRTTARKSVPYKCTTTTSNLNKTTSSSSSSDSPPPPSSATATSSPEFPSNDTGLLTSPSPDSNIANSDHKPHEKGEIDSVGDKEVPEEGNVVNSDSSVAGLSCCEAKDGILVGPTSGVVEGGVPAEIEGSINDVAGGTSSVGETGPGVEVNADGGPQVKGKAAGDGALDEGVDKAASRTRKVVKKVRIVKKIVKRRVPKRFVKGSVGNEQVVRLENGGGNNPIEENVNNLEAEKVDHNGSFLMETENPKPDHTVALGVENEDSKEIKTEVMECSKLGVSVRGIPSEVLDAEENDGKESERIEDQNVHFVGTKGGDSVEDRNAGCAEEEKGGGGESVKEVVENNEVRLNGGVALSDELEALEGQVDEEVKEVVENNDAEFNGGVALSGEMEASEEMEEVAVKEIDEKNDVVSDKGVALSGKPEVLEEKEEEAVKEIIEKNDVGSDKGIVFSGEMEALERKKRRRTEIFLGGIDKDAKEEDIRNVFEQAGEVMEVRLVMNSKTGKNKGFAFLRFASAADAKTALQKYSTVKICGKQCSAQLVEGNDTIFLGNINKKWKSEDVVKLLKDAGIEKIDKVIVMANPSNFELNRGFAFLEFETCKDAQIALSKLQKHDVFVNQMKINVDWAQPLIEPKEEEMLKVKTVYAEYLPPSWDEEKVREFFKRFGEVESITLAKKLPLSKRKDFAFVNYTRREAALACIEAFGHEQLDDEGSKVKLSLAKPIRSVKQMKHVSNTTEKGLEKEKRKASQSIIKVHEPRKRGKPASSNLDGVKVDRVASNNDDRLQLFRQQTLVGQTRPGSSTLHHHYGSTRSEQPLSALGIHPLPSDPSGFPRTRLETPHLSGIPSYLPTDPRGFPRTHLETPHLSGIPSAFSHRVGMESFPYSLQPRTSYKLESSYGFQNDPHVNMMRERANYYGHSGIYQRY